MTFRYCPLSIFADVKGGKRLPKGTNLSSTPNTHPYIRVRDLGTKKVLELTAAFEYVDDKTQAKISRYIVNTEDIIISIVGTIGLVAKIGKTLNGANLTENCAKIININGIDKDYLYYYLISTNGQNTIKAATVGAVQAKLPLKNIQNMQIPQIPLPTQRIIGATLSSLDDKIENNNAINQRFEQMAQAIFKSWFVDFESSTNGEFVRSELGEIPIGWRVGLLSDLINVKYGKDHKNLNEGNIPVFGSGGIMRYADSALYSEESVLVPRKGTLNNVIYINQPFWSVDTMFYTEMKKPNIAKFVYFFLRSKNLESMNTGSAVPSMTTKVLEALPVIMPPDSLLSEYEKTVDPLFRSMTNNLCENDNLASIRDSILSRLLSGELVKDDGSLSS